MEVLLLILLGCCLCIAGLLGLAFPALPGAPLLFCGLLLIAWAEDFAYVGTATLLILGFLAVMTYAVDLLAGAFGVKHFGASPRAMVGATIGAIVGIFLGLVGILLGPFIGAAIGELTVGRNLRAASLAGVGATLGMIIGVAAKLALAFAMIGLFVLQRFLGF